MQTPTIIKGRQFTQFIHDLRDKQAAEYPYSLELYLRSLLALILTHQTEETISYRFIAQLLEDAFAHPPIPFDETWHKFDRPPLAFLESDDRLAPFAVLRELLLYQISDLRLMQANGDLDQPAEILHFGTTSPTGNIWFNFDVGSYLSCATGELADETDLSQAGWEDLAILLYMGQVQA